MDALESMIGLRGKVAFVTGAASGIGKGIAAVLADAGATIIVLDRDLPAAEAVAADLGNGASAQFLDVTDEACVGTAIAALVERFGAPWLLVNCAGVQDRVRLLDSTAADWDRNYQVNLRGALFCLRDVAKAMIAAGAGGRIVNITSLAATTPVMAGLSAYSASKHGMLALTRSAALELLDHGITVNSVQPSAVGTAGARNASGPAPSGRITQEPPLGRVTTADIAGAVLYFASALAGRTTGQTLAVDAGYLLG